jgi:hypothetical protein
MGWSKEGAKKLSFLRIYWIGNCETGSGYDPK